MGCVSCVVDPPVRLHFRVFGIDVKASHPPCLTSVSVFFLPFVAFSRVYFFHLILFSLLRRLSDSPRLFLRVISHLQSLRCEQVDFHACSFSHHQVGLVGRGEGTHARVGHVAWLVCRHHVVGARHDQRPQTHVSRTPPIAMPPPPTLSVSFFSPSLPSLPVGEFLLSLPLSIGLASHSLWEREGLEGEEEISMGDLCVLL